MYKPVEVGTEEPAPGNTFIVTFMYAIQLVKCSGFATHHGSQVRVHMCMGLGTDYPTHRLQNKPKISQNG